MYDEKMCRWADVKMTRCEDEKMWRWEDVKMRRCEDEKMLRWEDVKMRRCEGEKMWRWEDEVRRCEDKKMGSEQVWRWEDVKMRRCEDEKMWSEKMWRWEDEKMRYRPPLLEEPCAQTLSGKIMKVQVLHLLRCFTHTPMCIYICVCKFVVYLTGCFIFRVIAFLLTNRLNTQSNCCRPVWYLLGACFVENSTDPKSQSK